MKIWNIGLGLLTLLLSFNLLFWGIPEVKNTSAKNILSQGDPTKIPTIAGLSNRTFDGGILNRQIETSESTDIIRKFPASICLLFFIFNPLAHESTGSLLEKSFDALVFKDLSLQFRNLRI